jgi:hypothetical protein
MIIDFLAVEKGRQLAKQNDRADIAFSQAQELADIQRETVLLDRQKRMTNEQATAYLAPLYGYQQIAAQEGVSDADFIARARDTIMADPAFQNMQPESQAQILKNISDTAIGIANRYRQNNDSATATRLYREFGQTGLAQNPLQMMGSLTGVLDAWASQPDSGLSRQPDGTYSLNGRILSPNEIVSLAAAKQANPQLTAVGGQLALLQSDNQVTAPQQQNQLALITAGFTDMQGDVAYKPDGSGGINVKTGQLVKDTRAPAGVPGATPTAGAPGASTVSLTAAPLFSLADLQIRLSSVQQQTQQQEQTAQALRTRLDQLAPEVEQATYPAGSTAELMAAGQPQYTRVYPTNNPAAMAEVSALENKLYDISRQRQTAKSAAQTLTQQLQAATAQVQTANTVGANSFENFDQAVQYDQLIDMGQSTAVKIPWLADQLKRYRDALAARKDPKLTALIQRADKAITNYGGAP